MTGRERRGARKRATKPLVIFCWLAVFGFFPFASASFAHPMGNFSISHYSGIWIDGRYVQIRYVLDLAEIPTFQEMQRIHLIPKEGDPSAARYLTDQAKLLEEGILLEMDGEALELQTLSSEIIFPAGAGGLPTMKMAFVFRAMLGGLSVGELHQVHYRDANYPQRTGWKEIVVSAAPGVTIESANAPSESRSESLSNYPTDLLNNPPQQLEAQIGFAAGKNAPGMALDLPKPASGLPGAREPSKKSQPAIHHVRSAEVPRASSDATGNDDRKNESASASQALVPNVRATPRNAFTELMNRKQLGIWIGLLAAAVAFGLGALHALEPGHGKTLVAAYLVGSQGTAYHALLLGLIVTASHTAGVFLLGAVTLYAQKYIVPERLYPWLGVISGLTIALLGAYLFLQRYLKATLGEFPLHGHSHGLHRHGGFWHSHDSDESSHSHFPSSENNGGVRGAVSYPQLLALGVTGGILPCPAALVVLLSSVALHRVGFGLFLIVAFSLGLAAVLIAMGMLVVFASRFMSRVRGEGPWLQKWLPMASAGTVTVLGFAIAVRALLAAGVLQIRF